MATPGPTPASPPPSTAPASAPSAPAAPPHRGLSGLAKIGIVVGVAAIVVVAVVLFAVLPSSPSGSSPAVVPVSSGSAISSAAGAASAHDAGSLLVAVGVAPEFSFSFGKETGNSSCPLADALSSNFTVPAESNYSAGTATLWLFVYYNAATPSESVVAVVGTATYFLGMVSGATCVSDTTIPTIPSGAVSSTVAASAADSDAGSYLKADPTSNGLYLLEGNTTTGSEWAVLYTNCSYDLTTDAVTGGTAANAFEATIDGTSGLVETDASLLGKFDCSTLGPGGSSPAYELGMEEFSSTGADTTFAIYLALSPTSGLETSMFGLKITAPSSATYPIVDASGTGCSVASATNEPSSCTGTSGGWYGVLVGVTGYIVAIYDASGWSYVSGSSVTLNGGYTLEIVTPIQIAGDGYTISVYSTGSASVSGSALL